MLVATGFALGADRCTLAPGRHDLTVRYEPLPSFKVRDHALTRFGALRWLGGGVLTSPNPHLGGLSGIKRFDGSKRLLSISDNGLWFSFYLKIDDTGAPVGIGKAWVGPMLDQAGQPMIRKSEADSEGLALRPRADGRTDYLVSFEGRPRIFVYRDEAAAADRKPLPLPADIRRYLGGNRGLEALAHATTGCRAGSSRRTATSRSSRFRPATTTRRPMPPSCLTAISCCWERRFNLSQGVGMRLRRFPTASLRKADGLTGTVLLEADLSYQIDNMEGLSIDVDKAGRVLFTIISDDNRSILQRTLLLRFQLMDAETAAPTAKPAR